MAYVITRVALITAAVLALSPEAALADTSGWTTSSLTFALDTNIINGCSAGDSVHIVGTGVIVVHSRTQNGTLQLREVDMLGGTGTGTSGARYWFGEAARINTNLGPNPDGTPFSYTERRVQILVGNGVPDQIITYNIRLVIDANGNVTTDVFDFNLVCR